MSTPPMAVTTIVEALLQGITDLWDEAVGFKVPETGPLTDTDGATAIAEMRTAVQMIDGDSAKLAVAFLAPPISVDAIAPLSEKFLDAVCHLAVRVFKLNNQAVGKQHARVLWVGMVKVLRAAKSFAQSLAAAGSKGPDVPTNWTGAGELGEACKTFLALPGSNHDALCAMLTQTQNTLEDGAAELQGEVQNFEARDPADDDDEGEEEEEEEEGDTGAEDDMFFQMMMGMGGKKSKWSTEELALMPNVYGILKVALNIVKKTVALIGVPQTSASADPQAQRAYEDLLGDTAKRLGAQADDFILVSYGPIDGAAFTVNLTALRDGCLALLDLSRKALDQTKPEPGWPALLVKATTHNFDKLVTAVAVDEPAAATLGMEALATEVANIEAAPPAV